MANEDIARLQDEDEWDFEAAKRQRVPDGRRAVVAVGFTTADFTLVADAAEECDQTLSQFIREAALARARGRESEGALR
jgi:hypothetical protein